jgi:hypothetical protein
MHHYVIFYQVPDNEHVPDKIDWLPNSIKSSDREFRGQMPISDAHLILFEKNGFTKWLFIKSFGR